MIARKLQDSPYPIAKFNQHVILFHLFPEYQPKDGFPVDTNILIDSDMISDDDDDDDGTTSLPTNEALPDDDSITNDASIPRPDTDLTTACNGEKHQGLTGDNDALNIRPDANLTTASSGDKRQGLSGENDASSLEADIGWTVSNSEGSIELEVRYQY